jgi:hypothetical protein
MYEENTRVDSDILWIIAMGNRPPGAVTVKVSITASGMATFWQYYWVRKR